MTVSAGFVDELDAERLRIARDLHDVVSYGFAAISVQAGVAIHVAEQKPQQAVEALQAITVASKEALEELRGILGQLRQPPGSRAASFGRDRFETLADTTSKSGIPTRLIVSGDLEDVPVSVGRAAYRIAQEALTNVLRHAGEASATITVAYEGDRLAVTVEDDGVGPAAAAKNDSPGSGLGILGMRERALALGGNLEAMARPQGGFRISASLPVAADS